MRRSPLVLTLLAPIAALVLPFLGGCQAPPAGATTFRVEPGAYDAAFQAVKDELRASGFELDRIDARAGVITTLPHFSAGLATPWAGDESNIAQEFEGLLNSQRRSVRVDFAPVEAPINPEGAALASIDPGVELRGRINVRLERMHRTGLRPSSVSVRLSSVARRDDQGAGVASDEPWTMTAIEDDDLLAARLVQGVARRVREP